MTNRTFVFSAFSLTVLAAVLPAQALDPATSDPNRILKAAVDAQAAERTKIQLRMSIRDGGGVRERIMSVRAKRDGESRKTLIVVESPEDMRNTGFLSFDYANSKQTDEQWLYLPALHRMSRVSASGKADAFLGSDFSLSDLATPDPNRFNLRLDSSARVDDVDCWLIEATPKDDSVQDETGYIRTQSWISKSTLLLVQSKAWLADKKRVKYYKSTKFRQVDGFWTAQRMQMRTVQDGKEISATVLEVLNSNYRPDDVVDSDFTVQRLERGL